MPTVAKIKAASSWLPVVIPVFLLFVYGNSSAQDTTVRRLPPIIKWEEYQQQVKDDPRLKMVELKPSMPGLVCDLRYASTHNFMNRQMYPSSSIALLRVPAAEALQKVQQELNKEKKGLKIFDAYRPYSVTVKFWELVNDERYVANPAKGSGHNRGVAVDLTIIELQSGKELDMGTSFDNFTDSAHHRFSRLPPQVLQNRKLLRSLMEKHGFTALETEWWHYSLPEANKFSLLDIGFDEF